jgi:KUP system potassium uptake protein
MGKEPFHWVVFDVLLLKCSAGTEALFADLGHFTYGSIQIAFSGLVYPSLLLAYLGQGAVLLNHPENADDPFYKSVPGVQSHLYVSLILLCM